MFSPKPRDYPRNPINNEQDTHKTKILKRLFSNFKLNFILSISTTHSKADWQRIERFNFVFLVLFLLFAEQIQFNHVLPPPSPPLKNFSCLMRFVEA